MQQAGHHRKLLVFNRRLRRRNKTLSLLFLLMLSIGVITAVGIHAKYRWLWRRALDVLAPAAMRQEAENQRCDVDDSFQTELLQQCALWPQKVCEFSLTSAMCLLRKTKEDLDTRTSKLHADADEVMLTLSKLQSQDNHTDLNNISLIYFQRPCAHLNLYYSHELQPGDEKDNSILKWSVSNMGLSVLRAIAIDPMMPHSSFTIQQAGYYYIYSHVTYQITSTSPWFGHFVYKFKGNVCGEEKLLEATYIKMPTGKHVSYLQGVFLLLANESLCVKASLTKVDRIERERTFFGAFQI